MRKISGTAFFVILFFIISVQAFAQSTKTTAEVKKPKEVEKTQKTKQAEKFEKRKSGAYLKTELIHGDFGFYGYNYYFNDLSFEIENHWAKPHGGFAGFSFGYRKEDFSSSEYGHFVNGKFFWKAEKHGFYFKPGVGVEWGKPSYRFEQTKFKYSATELVSYERISLKRNAWMPVGVKNTGTLYPILEVSVGQKVGPFLFEGGTRFGYNKFGIDTFQFKNGALTFQGLNNEYKLIPTFYIGIGVKLF